MQNSGPPLAYGINDFSKEVGLGRTYIFAAIKAGELRTISPIIGGKIIKRKLITPEEGKRWLSTFPVA